VGRQLELLHPQASVQLFSSHTRAGCDELTAVLDRWLGFGQDAQDSET
jgi:hypothetical protein